MIINNKIEHPYNKIAPDSPMPLISKNFVKSILSSKFEDIVIDDVEIKYNHFVNYNTEYNIEERERGNMNELEVNPKRLLRVGKGLEEKKQKKEIKEEKEEKRKDNTGNYSIQTTQNTQKSLNKNDTLVGDIQAMRKRVYQMKNELNVFLN